MPYTNIERKAGMFYSSHLTFVFAYKKSMLVCVCKSTHK